MNILFVTHKDIETTRKNLNHILRLPFEKNIYFYNDLGVSERDLNESLMIRRLATEYRDNINDVFFTDTNLGIKKSIPAALAWFFSEVTFGVIVEYDCIVSKGGFRFISEAERRFSSYDNITSISANNITKSDFVSELKFLNGSVTPIWGWASWRSEVEKWLAYQPKFGFSLTQAIEKLNDTNAYEWLVRNQSAYEKGLTKGTWSDRLINYQLNEGKLAIIPSTNLVTNIGFENGTLNSRKGSLFANMKIGNYEKFTNDVCGESKTYNEKYFKLANIQQKRDLRREKLRLSYIINKLKRL